MNKIIILVSCSADAACVCSADAANISKDMIVVKPAASH